MAKKSVDLTSQEWRNLVFAGKNQDFGAYQLRKQSDKRHNMAFLYMLMGLVVIFILIIALSKYSDYRAEQDAIALQEQREKMMAAQLTQEEDVQKEDNTARGVVTQEGSDDADKFKAVQEQVVVKEPEPEKPKEEEIFVAVEQQAEFPGGQTALMKWLSNNVRYPESAQQNDIQGRVVVRFVVEKDGSIGAATIVKGVDKDLDREALRVVKKMPRWQPGKNNGVAVRSYFNLPVVFKLQNQ